MLLFFEGTGLHIIVIACDGGFGSADSLFGSVEGFTEELLGRSVESVGSAVVDVVDVGGIFFGSLAEILLEVEGSGIFWPFFSIFNICKIAVDFSSLIEFRLCITLQFAELFVVFVQVFHLVNLNDLIEINPEFLVGDILEFGKTFNDVIEGCTGFS